MHCKSNNDFGRGLRRLCSGGAEFPGSGPQEMDVDPDARRPVHAAADVRACAHAFIMALPPHMSAGILLVAACPVGDIANFYNLLARANVALSVTDDLDVHKVRDVQRADGGAEGVMQRDRDTLSHQRCGKRHDGSGAISSAGADTETIKQEGGNDATY